MSHNKTVRFVIEFVPPTEEQKKELLHDAVEQGVMSKEDAENAAGRVAIGMCIARAFVECDGKRIAPEDLMPEDPQQYIDNGVAMAVAHAVARGLNTPRGVSIASATQDAQEKMQEAYRIVDLRDVLGKLSLAATDTDQCGEC